MIDTHNNMRSVLKSLMGGCKTNDYTNANNVTDKTNIAEMCFDTTSWCVIVHCYYLLGYLVLKYLHI